MAKNPFNQRNPRLINDLHAYGIFTLVKDSLQINLFMQNKANFRKSQMNVTDYITREYEKKDTWWSGKKQSQTKPNKAKFKKAKMNVTSIITKGYENKTPIRAPKKQSQFSLTTKTNANLFVKKDYEENRAFGLRKNKPKQSQPVVSLPALSAVEGVESVSEAKNAAACVD